MYTRLLKEIAGFVAALALLFGLAACGQAETSAPPATEPAEQAEPTDVVEPTEAVEPTEVTGSAEATAEPIRIDGGDGPPFYARFGEFDTNGDDNTVVIMFYRPVECIPEDFNMYKILDVPDENGPGAFGCAPLTVHSLEYWVNGPESDPSPVRVELTGLGAVPVWFIDRTDINNAIADNVVTIADLGSLPSLRVGTAANFTELLLPGQSIQFRAEGTLEDGVPFLVDISSGAGVENHATIEFD